MPWGPAAAPRRCPDPASCFVPAPRRGGAAQNTPFTHFYVPA
eukprot:SAG25_NODE_5220_length_685_cov_1.919932_1_plen_41_part_01